MCASSSSIIIVSCAMTKNKTKEKKEGGKKKRTRSQPDSLCIVICNVVLNPLPVSVSLAKGFFLHVESVGDGAVSDQARC